MRVALTHKFVLGSLAVACASIALPEILRASGVVFPVWGAIFVALGLGGCIGFALSRALGKKFAVLIEATERIREGLYYTHRWRAGDLVIWDNRCTNHKRAEFDTNLPRVMHRVQIAGTRPF